MPITLHQAEYMAPNQIAPIIWRIHSIHLNVVTLVPYQILYGNIGLSNFPEQTMLKVSLESFVGAERFVQTGMLAIGARRGVWVEDRASFWDPYSSSTDISTYLTQNRQQLPSPGGPGVYQDTDWASLSLDYTDPSSYEFFFLLDTGNVDTWTTPLGRVPPSVLRIEAVANKRGGILHRVRFRYYNEMTVTLVQRGEQQWYWAWSAPNKESLLPTPSRPINPHSLRFDPFLDTFTFDAMDQWFRHLEPVSLPVADPDEQGPGFIQIGYVLFRIDPTAITFNTQYPIDTVPLLRAAGTHKMVRPQSVTTWRMQVVLDGEDINDVLVPLLRQIDRCPFLPVINTTFNKMGIEAIAIEQVQVETAPQTPNAVILTLGGHEFKYLQSNVHPFAPMLLAFNWPLFKIYTDYLPRFHRADQIPFTGQVLFRIPTERYLREALDKLSRTLTVSEQLMLNITGGVGATQFDVQAVKQAAMRGEALLLPLEGGRKYYAWMATDPQSFRESIMAALPAKDPNSERIEGKGRAFVREVHANSISEQSLTLEQTYDLLSRFENAMREDRDMAHRLMHQYAFVIPASDDAMDPALGLREQLQIQSRLGILSRTRAIESQNLIRAEPNYQEISFPSVVWERLIFSFANHISTLEREAGGLIHQFLGRGDTMMVLEGVSDMDGVRQLKLLVEAFRAIAFVFRGFGILRDFYVRVQVVNELAQVMGVVDVLPVSLDVETVQGSPNTYRVSLTLVSFDPGQISREQVQRLSPWNAEIFTREVSNRRGEWQFGPMALAAYSNVLNGQLAQLEVYPDLRLPTYRTVNRWVASLASASFLRDPSVLDEHELLVRESITELYPDELIPVVVEQFHKMYMNGLVLPDLPQYVDPDFYFSVGGEAGRVALAQAVASYAYGSVDLGIPPDLPIYLEHLDAMGVAYSMNNSSVVMRGTVTGGE